MMNWLWEDRLVQVWAEPGRAGSGVAFGAAGVLTAYHVVAEGSPARVKARTVRRTDPASAGRASAPWVSMRMVAAAPDWDLAVLEASSHEKGAVPWRSPASVGPRLAAVSGGASWACESVGFPDANVQGLTGIQPADRVRQSEHAVGVLLPFGQVKPYSGASPMPIQVMPLDVVSATPERAAKWGGMSGAGVVLADGRLAGIVVGVEPGRQVRRLLVVPLALALTSSQPLRSALESVSGRPLVIEPRQASRLPGEHSIEQFLADHLTLREGGSILFGGRDDELDRLNRWARDPAGPPCFVLCAPPGRGKSTLLARWWHEYRDGPVVLVPISIRHDMITEQDVLRALVARLAAAHRRDPVEVSAEASTGMLRDRLAEYFGMPAPTDQNLVIVVDGLDEALGWDPSYALSRPERFGSRVRLLVAARQTEELPDAESWRAHLHWPRNEDNTMDLAVLTERGIGQVLEDVHPSLTPAQAAVRSVLFDLTGGDPLVVRLYVEELEDARDRDAWIATVDRTDRPRGLTGYLRRWMAEQTRLWGGRLGSRPRAVSVVFSVLACAYAPLTRHQLLQLVRRGGVEGGDALDTALADLRRFVITDPVTGTTVLSHPRIGEQRRDDLERDEELAGYDLYFIDHYSAQQPEWTESEWRAIDTYGLSHLTAHICRASRPELLHTLLRRERQVDGHPQNGWYYAKTSAGQLDSYLADISEAWQRTDQLPELARYALYAMSVRAGTANVPVRLLELCVQYGVLTWQQAFDAARAQRHPGVRARAIAHLLPPLMPMAAWEEAARAELRTACEDQAVLREIGTVAPEELACDVLAAAETFGDDRSRAGIVVTLASRLPDRAVTTAVRIAHSVDDRLGRIRALAALAARAPEPLRGRLLLDAEATVTTMPDDEKKGLALCAVAQAAPDPEPIIRDAFALAKTLDNAWEITEVLTELARLDLDERFMTDILDFAERIYRDENSDATDIWYLQALISVGRHAAPALRSERAERFINQMLCYTGTIGRMLARQHIPLLVPLLQPGHRRKTLDGLIGAVVGIAGKTAFVGGLATRGRAERARRPVSGPAGHSAFCCRSPRRPRLPCRHLGSPAPTARRDATQRNSASRVGPSEENQRRAEPCIHTGRTGTAPARAGADPDQRSRRGARRPTAARRESCPARWLARPALARRLP